MKLHDNNPALLMTRETAEALKNSPDDFFKVHPVSPIPGAMNLEGNGALSAVNGGWRRAKRIAAEAGGEAEAAQAPPKVGED